MFVTCCFSFVLQLRIQEKMDGWTPTNQFPPKKGSGFQKWRDKVRITQMFKVVLQNAHKCSRSSLCLYWRSHSAMISDRMHWPLGGYTLALPATHSGVFVVSQAAALQRRLWLALNYCPKTRRAHAVHMLRSLIRVLHVTPSKQCECDGAGSSEQVLEYN